MSVIENLRNDVLTMREYLLNALKATNNLKAVSEGAPISEEALQKTLEKISGQFEFAVLELRELCERYTRPVGGYPKPRLMTTDFPTGNVELLDGRWLRITLNTLLPHCRYQPAVWLTDTIRRLLDEYEFEQTELPYFHEAILVIEEACTIDGRHIFDQDNKGWKAVSNAIKRRLIPDDDQFSLGLMLLSVYAPMDACRITVLPRQDLEEFIQWHEKREQKS